jgi:hypothetical protein
MRFRTWVRFPDGAIRHARYDSVTDTVTRFLCADADEALHLGGAMDDDYDPAWDGLGMPVTLATDYDDTHWPGTAYREPGSDWWWLTSGTEPGDDVIREGLPGWARG